MDVLKTCGDWDSAQDAKLEALLDLLTKQHPTKRSSSSPSLPTRCATSTEQLKARGVKALDGVTGDTDDPTAIAWRFSPDSNEQARARVSREDELRVVVATDVLSEGQNLQDCCHRRQLRPALGHHPADSARRPRGPHRPEVGHDPLLLVPARRWRRADHPPALPGAPAPAGERRGRRHGRGLLRG